MGERIAIDVPIEKTTRILSFMVKILDLNISHSARFRVMLECESDGQKSLEAKELTIEGDEYLKWGSDDSYLIELIKSKLPTLV